MTASSDTRTALQLINSVRDSPLTQSQARELILESIADVAAIERETILPSDALEDLDLDSLALTELLVTVEEALEVEVPAELLDRFIEDDLRLETVGDLLKLLIG